MIHVHIRHRVRDYEAWRKHFEAFAVRRRLGGELSFRFSRALDDPNNLYLVFEWDSPANAQRFLASGELAKVMLLSGVVDKPDIQITEELCQGRQNPTEEIAYAPAPARTAGYGDSLPPSKGEPPIMGPGNPPGVRNV